MSRARQDLLSRTALGVFRLNGQFLSVADELARPAGLTAAFFMLRIAVPRSVLILDPILLVASMGGSRLIYRMHRERRMSSRLPATREPVLVLGAGVAVVPNGIDLPTFRPPGPPVGAPRVVFCGVMDYAPNASGAEWLARRVWPGEPAVGKQLWLGEEAAFEVIGMVGDVRNDGLAAPAESALYVPSSVFLRSSVKVFVRAEPGLAPESLAPAVRQAVWEVNPQQPIADMAPVRMSVSTDASRIARGAPVPGSNSVSTASSDGRSCFQLSTKSPTTFTPATPSGATTPRSTLK